MSVSKDFEELLGSLNAHEVRALVVGGFAFAYHARPRYTKDIDIWIDPSPENVERLLRALDDFGFGSVGLKPEDFSTPGRFVQLGFPPNRIDIMTSVPGVGFAEAWEGRVEDLYGETRVCYLGRTDLIRSKKAAGRPQDLADLDVLHRFSRE